MSSSTVPGRGRRPLIDPRHSHPTYQTSLKETPGQTTAHSRFAGDAPPRRAPESGRAPLRRSHQFVRASLRGPRRRGVSSSFFNSTSAPPRRAARSAVARPELVTSPPGSPAHAQSPPCRLPPPRPAPALIPGRVAAIAPGRHAPVGTPRRGNFLLLYTSGRGAAFRRGQGVVNAPRCATLWCGEGA